MNRTPNIDDELIIEIVKGMTMFAFQRGNWQKPIEPHELIEYTTAIKTLLANKIKEAELRGRIDELGGVKEHHESIPLPWEVGTGPYIEGRLTQLTNQHKGEQDDE